MLGGQMRFKVSKINGYLEKQSAITWNRCEDLREIHEKNPTAETQKALEEAALESGGGEARMSNPGSDLARLRKTGTRVCAECGNSFVARLTALYCSDPCRMKAAYKKRKKGKR